MARSQDSIVVLRALKELSTALETLKDEVEQLRNSISHMELNMHIHLPDDSDDSDDSDTESEVGEEAVTPISNETVE